MSVRCEYADKVQYTSKKVARAALRGTPLHGKTVRVYKCDACQHFHVTKERTTRLVSSRVKKIRKKVLDSEDVLL